MKKSSSLLKMKQTNSVIGAYGRGMMWLLVRGLMVFAGTVVWRLSNEVYDKVRGKERK